MEGAATPGGAEDEAGRATVGAGLGGPGDVATSDSSRRSRPWVVVTLALLLVLVLAGTAVLVVRSRSTPRFCTLEGLIDPTGRHTYHRDLNRDCEWVDETGKPMGTGASVGPPAGQSQLSTPTSSG